MVGTDPPAPGDPDFGDPDEPDEGGAPAFGSPGIGVAIGSAGDDGSANGS